MRKTLVLGCVASLFATGVAAQSAIEIQRAVYLQKKTQQAGRIVHSLEPAERLRRGDSVVLMLEWSAPGRSRSFAVSSRVPRDLAFQRSNGRQAEVSVDNGRNWGRLGVLRTGARKAAPEDVTHVRWMVSDAEAAFGSGMMTYSAIVR
ncbi:hypothetical protein [Qipengyuania sp. JC766]|uniref:hypothetical protein n=1 Tax=Qipengyuania sp. JC766 TaxID=3232139 RepID=UPI00345B2A4C